MLFKRLPVISIQKNTQIILTFLVPCLRESFFILVDSVARKHSCNACIKTKLCNLVEIESMNNFCGLEYAINDAMWQDNLMTGYVIQSDCNIMRKIYEIKARMYPELHL